MGGCDAGSFDAADDSRGRVEEHKIVTQEVTFRVLIIQPGLRRDSVGFVGLY